MYKWNNMDIFCFFLLETNMDIIVVYHINQRHFMYVDVEKPVCKKTKMDMY